MATRAFSERYCDGFVVLFAAWTLCCHTAVLLGGSLRQLLAGTAVAAIAGLAAMATLARRVDPRTSEGLATAGHEPEFSRPKRVLLVVMGTAAAASVAALCRTTGGVTGAWWIAVVYFGAAVVLAGPPDSRPTPARADAGWEIGLWLLALAAAAFALIAHDPDRDDSVYLNLAVTAAGAPTAPLMVFDGVYGIPGLPLMPSFYKVQSLELLGGAVDYATGLPAIVFSHVVLAVPLALLTVFATATLFRVLTPGHWLLATCALLLVMIGVGDPDKGYGSFWLSRLHQGKSVLLAAVLPLTVALALRFAQAPSARRWLLLALVQVAALGLSVNALYAAPLTAGLALSSQWDRSWRGCRTIGLGLLASIYPLAWSALLFADSGATVNTLPASVSNSQLPPGELLAMAAQRVFGEGRYAIFGVFALFAAGGLAPGATARCFLTAAPLGFLLLLFDPYSARLVAENVTSLLTYWRVFWVIPIPAIMTITLVSSAWLVRPGRWNPGGLLAVLVVAGFVIAVPQRSLLQRPGLSFTAPGLKVPHDEYRLARLLNERAGAASHVLAPTQIATWVPTSRGHAFPIATREIYLNSSLAALIGPSEVARRGALIAYVQGTRRSEGSAEDLQDGIRAYDLSAVCLRASAPWISELREVLEDAGFSLSDATDGFEIWLR